VISSRRMSVRRSPDPAGYTLKSASTLPPKGPGPASEGPRALACGCRTDAAAVRLTYSRLFQCASGLAPAHRAPAQHCLSAPCGRPQIHGHQAGPRGAPGSTNGQAGSARVNLFVIVPRNGAAGFGAPLIVRHPKPGVACAQGADRALACPQMPREGR
jgi:hypothetical protein